MVGSAHRLRGLVNDCLVGGAHPTKLLMIKLLHKKEYTPNDLKSLSEIDLDEMNIIKTFSEFYVEYVVKYKECNQMRFDSIAKSKEFFDYFLDNVVL